MKPIAEKYNPQKLEQEILQLWSHNNFFQAFQEKESERPSFSVILPPPNITGKLHIGHALNGTLQDVLVRWKRMLGFDTLWLPGTDHAGIATQARVEKELMKKNMTKQSLGRQAFVEKVWAWKKEYGGHILEQMKIMGFSCDWSRHTFTLDKSVSQAVRKVFVDLYKKKRIYKGLKLINWSPKLESAISDLEVEHREVQGTLWHISYPLCESERSLVVATTRPETLFGDVAVCVNPKDRRYEKFIGQKVKLPLTDRTLPVIEDDYVDFELGTGVLKITPAHDFNDYEVGQRHNLDPINILNKDGTLNDKAGPYKGLSVSKARKKVLEDLRSQNLLVKEVPHKHFVSHCERSGCVVEPFLSEQWFLKTFEMAVPAKQVVENGNVVFQPKSWEKTYLHWMNNIQDWCLSRQLWWGHQIPCWVCQDCEHFNVSQKDVVVCEECEGKNLKQDSDVLDTWFSSALWPFSTLGWPSEEKDCQELQDRFYPTDVLITGHEIIFFWVARMIMMGLEFKKDVPFRKVFLHGVVRDQQGRKMSKSLDNAVDPLDVVEQFGADALRFTLLSQSSTKDTRFSIQALEKNRNFMNKVWNAARFSFNILETFSVEKLSEKLDVAQLKLSDHWILKKLSEVQTQVSEDLEQNYFHEAHHKIYHFFWTAFCDWYLEMSKAHFYSQEKGVLTESHKVLFQVFQRGLKLLHPFAPFLTEALYQRIYETSKAVEKSISISSFPTTPLPFEQKQAECAERLIDVITGFRNFKGENAISPAKKLTGFVQHTGFKNLEEASSKDIVTHLAGLKELVFLKEEASDKAAFPLRSNLVLYLDLSEGVDKAKEAKRLKRAIEKLEKRNGKT